MRTVFLVMIIAAGFALVGTTEASAAAANGTVISWAAQQSETTILVVDGCGRGRHFSKYRGYCVWNSAPSYGYQPTIVYGYPAYYSAPGYGYRGYIYGYPAYSYPYWGYYWGW